MTEPKWKRHGTLRIGIAYEAGAKSIHEGLPCRHESLTLDFFRMDYDLLGLPQRLWLTPVHADAETKKCRVDPEDHGLAQLEGLSSESLEVLRNALVNLGQAATAVLNARGRALNGLPERTPPGERL